MKLRKITVICLLVVSLLYTSTPAFAMSPEEEAFLAMYFKPEELKVISTTRSLKSISRVAENVEVVTAEDIELMNAHTVAEAIYNVTGVEMQGFVGPGAQGAAGIYGSEYTRVSVLLDGVPLQNQSNGVALAILPVQMIEKIEIIKGPASSTWGSSFGGVIHIITKSVKAGTHMGGTIYASGGERSTSDLKAEVYGRKDRFGIYLYGGTMNSDGLVGNHEFWHNNFFSKITFDAGQKTKIDASFLYHRSDSVQWDYLIYDYDAYDAYDNEHIYGRVGLQTELSRNINLDLSGWLLLQDTEVYQRTVSGDDPVWNAGNQYDKYGFSSILTLKAGDHMIVAGADGLTGKLDDTINQDKLDLKKFALFVNDTFSINKLSITPGLRYDNSNISDNILSPSLGITYTVSRNLLLRAIISRGFHDPLIVDSETATNYVGNPDIKTEKIWSYEVGGEANVGNILKAKLTIFRHDIDDIRIERDLGDGTFTTVNGGEQRVTGGEIKIDTREYRGFTLRGGFHYERIKLLEYDDIRFFNVTKRYGFNTSIDFSDGKGLKADLKGHYLWWNLPAFWGGKYDGFVVDFNVIKDIVKKDNMILKVFFTAHNIFDAASYDNNLTPNPDRWVEAGLKFTF